MIIKYSGKTKSNKYYNASVTTSVTDEDMENLYTYNIKVLTNLFTMSLRIAERRFIKDCINRGETPSAFSGSVGLWLPAVYREYIKEYFAR